MTTAVGTVTARTGTFLRDDVMTVIRTDRVQSHTGSPHQGTLGKDPTHPSAMAKTTETETTTDTTAGTETETAATGTETETAGTETGTAGTGTETETGITATVNTGRWTTTVLETIVWT